MNYKEFAQNIKTKYPDYNDMDDLELAKKVVAKYPEYNDITFDNVQDKPAQQEPQKTSGINAAAHGFSQGVTLGAGLPVTSGIQAVIQTLMEGKKDKIKLSPEQFNAITTSGKTKLTPEQMTQATKPDELTKNYKEFYQQNKAEEDLLKNQHPLAYASGEVASYATPGGAGKVFGAASKAGNLIKGTSTVSKLGKLAVGSGVGVGAVEGAKKLLSEGDPLAAIQEGGLQGLTAAVASPVVAGAAKLVAAGAKPLVKGWISWASKTPYEALKEYATNPATRKMLEQVVNKEPQIAEDIVAKIQAIKQSRIPEYDEALKALEQMTSVPVKGVKKVLTSTVKAGPAAPSEEPAINMVQKWIDEYIPKYAGKKSTISGKQAASLKRALQGEVEYGKAEIPKYQEVMKSAAATLRQDIEAASQSAKNPAASSYVENMKIVASKMQALEDLKKALGNTTGKWDDRALSLFKRAKFDNGKPNYEMSLLQNFDKQFGTNYAEMADASRLGRQLGGAKPKIFPQWQTGGIFGPLATAFGAFSGGLPGATATIPALAATSPRLSDYGLRLANATGKGASALEQKGLPLSQAKPTASYEALKQYLQSIGIQ